MEKWRMPDKEELNLMYNNLHKFGVGGFADNYYWSSYDFKVLLALAQGFDYGNQVILYKSDHRRVRAVRDFISLENLAIGDKTSRGIIFYKKGAKYKECKFQDESGKYTWDEAMKLFQNEIPLKEVIEDYVRKNKSKSPLLVATPRMEQRNKI